MRITLAKPISVFIILLIYYSSVFSQHEAEVDSVRGKKLYVEGMKAFKGEGDWEILREKFTEAIPLLEKDGPWPIYIKMGRGLFMYYNENFDLDSITKYSNISYHAARTHETNKKALYRSVFDRGTALQYQGAYTEAIQLYEEVHEYYLTDSSTSKTSYADLYQSLGLCYDEKGDYDEAMRYFDRSIELSIDESSAILAMRYNQKAKLLTILKREREAIQLYQSAIAHLNPKDDDERRTLINFYLSLGLIYNDLEENEKVLHFLDKAKKLQLEDAGYLVEVNYDMLSNFHFRQNDFEMALHYQDLLEKEMMDRVGVGERHPKLITAIQKKAEIFAKTGAFENAISISQNNIVKLCQDWDFSANNENPAVKDILQPIYALPIIKAKGAFWNQWYQQSNNIQYLENSLEAYQLASDLITSMRIGFKSKESTLLLADITTSTLEEAITVAFELYQATGENAYVQQALNFMEQDKAVLLHANLKDMQAKGAIGIPDSIRTKENDLINRIHKLQRKIFQNKGSKESPNLQAWQAELFQLENEQQALAASLEENFPGYYKLKYASKKLEWIDLKQKLSTGDLLLEFFLGNESIYAIAIGKKHQTFVRLGQQEEIADKIQAFIHLLNDEQRVQDEAFSQSYFKEFIENNTFLYQVLLEPILQSFPKYKRLVVVPDGPLGFLPFGVLVNERMDESEPINYRDLNYLFKEYPITYQYSAALWRDPLHNRSGKRTSKLLSVAPSFGKVESWDEDVTTNLRPSKTRAGFSPLHFNHKEAAAIQKIWNGELLENSRAIEALFKERSGDCNILHLATHAFTNEQNPELSGLVFTDYQASDSTNSNREEDGILYAHEIYSLDLIADLVILSACNTGSGQHRQGEGVMSLSRAFAYAGCPSAAMSMWQADDESIASIMERFHTYLKAGKSKSAAMQQAKLDFLKSSDRAHPYFWAAFLTIGDDRPLDTGQNYIWLWGIIALIALAGFGMWKRRFN